MERDALLADVRAQLLRRFQRLLDKTTPHPLARWLALAALQALYAVRVYRLDGWFIVSYGLAIYMLSLFVGFISPQVDPESADGGGAVLPTSGGGGGGGGGGGADLSESKGFTRKLPEFKFWFSAVRATLIAFGMTCTELFNVPVFWPILVLYFCLLLTFTLRKQIAHMVKHRYLPFSFGKPSYARGKGAAGGGGGGGGGGGVNSLGGASAAIWKGSAGAT